MQNAADNMKTKLSHYIFFQFYCVFKFAFSGLFYWQLFFTTYFAELQKILGKIRKPSSVWKLDQQSLGKDINNYRKKMDYKKI